MSNNTHICESSKGVVDNTSPKQNDPVIIERNN
jgi:hypothetical protein